VPLVHVFTNVSTVAPARQEALLGELSRLAAARFGKSEDWVMTCLVPGLVMTFAGTTEPTALVAVKNIGTMTPAETVGLSHAICDEVGSALGVAPDRIYVQFTDLVDYLWGWNGTTFA
jgi:phenylpyruvate tautomerase